MRQIKPVNNHGSIQLKFSFAGKRYSFNPIPGGQYGNPRDLSTAQAIATRIQNDVLAGNFDKTLNRYRITPKAAQQETPKEAAPKTLLALWDRWVETLDLSPETKADHYEMIRRMIVRAKPGIGETRWLTKADLAASTINKRLSYVRSCFRWAVSRGFVEESPWEAIKPRKAAQKEIRPFSPKEAKAVLKGFQRLAPHYEPFIRFLFLTGVRLSEAIGLRWGAVDWEAKTVTIRESLSKDRTGNSYRRIRKKTKTGSIRTLGLSEELETLLRSRWSPEVSPEDLVFLTPKGCVIDSGNFRQLWVEVLDSVGVPYRRLHDIRHNLASHAIAQGIPLTGVSYLLGHKDTTMVIRTYGHLIDRPDLPDLGI